MSAFEISQIIIKLENQLEPMMKLLTRIINFRVSIAQTNLSKCLQPVSLNARETGAIPVLKLKSQKYLMKNWWAEKPFEVLNQMTVPVFSFDTASFANKSIDLPQDIFNHPLRRDLMHRLYDFRINLNKFRTKVTRDRAMTAGSGKKMRAQKKTGSARMGEKRAPHLRKGGKAHGAKAMIYSYHLNAKIKLRALKALLSAKLVEGKIKVVTAQNLAQPKTKVLSKILDKYSSDSRTLFCIITSQSTDGNFALANRNIDRVIHHTPYSLDVMSLFKADKILITQQGLQELIQNIYKTQYLAFRHPHMKKLEEKEVEEERIDPEQPYEFKFKILAEYMDLYNKIREEKPEVLERELGKIRKVDL